MKTKIILLLAVLSFNYFLSQEDETFFKTDVLYDVHLPLRALKCKNIDGLIDSKDSIYVDIKKGSTFYVLDEKDDGSKIVQFWFEDIYENTKYDKEVVYDSQTKKRITYLIRKKDILNKTRRRYSIGLGGTSITGGVTLLPFKIRPSVKIEGKRMGFDFSKDIQLGISGGLKQRISKYNPFYLNALLNFGISSVLMDSYNTNGKLNESIDVAAFTYGAGLVLDFNKIQFGVFLGRDLVSDKNNNDWIYQNKTWWSIGFGYSIFSVSTKPIFKGSEN